MRTVALRRLLARLHDLARRHDLFGALGGVSSVGALLAALLLPGSAGEARASAGDDPSSEFPRLLSAPDVGPALDRVEALLLADRWREALTGAELAVDHAPLDGRALFVLAQVSWRAGQPDRSFELARRALSRLPEDGRVWALLTQCALASGDREEAARYGLGAVRSTPSSSDAWLARAASQAEAGLGDAARESLERATRAAGGRMPDSPLETRRIRRVMERVLGRVGAGVLLDAPSRKGRELLDLTSGRPIVSLLVAAQDGGATEIPALIDTGGSSALALDAQLASTLAFEDRGEQVVAGFRAEAELARAGLLARVEMGDWSFEWIPTLCYPLGDGAEAPPYRCIVGPVLFDDRVLVLNLRRGAVALLEGSSKEPTPAQLSEGEVRLPFWRTEDGKVLIQLSVGGELFLCLVDTGSRTTFCSAQVAREGRWGPLELGGRWLEMAPPPGLEVLEERVSRRIGMEVSLLLGMDFWGRFGILTFDFRHQTLTLTPRSEKRR